MKTCIIIAENKIYKQKISISHAEGDTYICASMSMYFCAVKSA